MTDVTKYQRKRKVSKANAKFCQIKIIYNQLNNNPVSAISQNQECARINFGSEGKFPCVPLALFTGYGYHIPDNQISLFITRDLNVSSYLFDKRNRERKRECSRIIRHHRQCYLCEYVATRRSNPYFHIQSGDNVLLSTEIVIVYNFKRSRNISANNKILEF